MQHQLSQAKNKLNVDQNLSTRLHANHITWDLNFSELRPIANWTVAC